MLELKQSGWQDMDDKEINESTGVEIRRTMETTGSALPSDVVERILCEIPFPGVLKVRSLNRRWRYQFPSLIRKHQADTKWPTYCPAFLGPGEVFGFNRSSNSWQRMKFPALHDGRTIGIPKEDLELRYHTQALAGPLLCTFMRKPGNKVTVTVANLLTGNHRVIRCPETLSDPWFTSAQPPVLRLVGDESFEILIIDKNTRRGIRKLETHMYSSKSDSWTYTSPLPIERDVDLALEDRFVHCSDHVYLDGTFCWLEEVDDEDMTDIGLVRVIAEDNQWGLQNTHPLIEFQPGEKISLNHTKMSVVHVGMGTILVLLLYHHQYAYALWGMWSAEIKLYQVGTKDSSSPLRSGSGSQVIELSPAPTLLYPGPFKRNIVVQADGNCIYFCGQNLNSYNLEEDTWTDHGVLPDAAYWKGDCFKQCVKFEPSWNPFMVP